MLDFSSKAEPMSTAVEARSLIVQIAGPQPLGGGNVKGALARVARRSRLGLRRVKAIFYGEARRIDADELKALRAAARDTTANDAGRDELTDLRARIARLETLLARADAHMAGALPDLDRRGSGGRFRDSRA